MSDAVNIIDYELDHLFDISIDFNKYPLCQNNITILAQIFQNGISRTVLDNNGKPIAIISVMLLHKGVACVHIVPSIEAHKSKRKSFISAILKLRSEGKTIREIQRVTFYWDKNNHKKFVSVGYIHKILKGDKNVHLSPTKNKEIKI